MGNHLRMSKEEPLKKLYYDLKNPAAYAGKSKLLQEAGNHLIITKEELLKKLYYDLKNPAAYSGKSTLLQEAKKHDSNISTEDVEGLLKSQLAYTLYKPIHLNFNTRLVVVHQINEQWHIDLVDKSKLSKHNDGFKFIMVVIDILSKYAWLESHKSKHGIAIKNALEHIFSQTIVRPKVIHTDKGTKFLKCS